MKILMAYPQTYYWEETGRFIHEAFARKDHEVIVFDDIRAQNLTAQNDVGAMNRLLIKAVEKHNPDTLLMLKSEQVSPMTLERIKCKKVLWHPDVRKNVQEWVVDKAKKCDIFFTMSPGSIPEYQSKGVDAKYLPEACDPNYHFNANWVDDYWKSDVNFIGTIRQSRVDMCKRIIDEGFDFKAWGSLPAEYMSYDGSISRLPLRDRITISSKHMNRHIWREYHSYVASNSIGVTWDWCPEVERSYSARIYRVMASRGLYLCKYVNGMEKVFKRGIHCDWFETLNEMTEKINYYLSNPLVMKKIGEGAQNEVYKNHTFDNRIEVIEKCLADL